MQFDILKVTSLVLQTSPAEAQGFFPACVCQRGFLCKRGMKCQRSLDTGSPGAPLRGQSVWEKSQLPPRLLSFLFFLPFSAWMNEASAWEHPLHPPPDSIHSRPRERDGQTWRGLEGRKRKTGNSKDSRGQKNGGKQQAKTRDWGTDLGEWVLHCVIAGHLGLIVFVMSECKAYISIHLHHVKSHT